MKSKTAAYVENLRRESERVIEQRVYAMCAAMAPGQKTAM